MIRPAWPPFVILYCSLLVGKVAGYLVSVINSPFPAFSKKKKLSSYVFCDWPHWTDHNRYPSTTQTLLEYLIRYLRPPEDGNHLPKHVGGKIWNTLIKSTSSLTHRLVILQRCYKMLGPTIKMSPNVCDWMSCQMLLPRDLCKSVDAKLFLSWKKTAMARLQIPLT
jgi:hypothetical protein